MWRFYLKGRTRSFLVRRAPPYWHSHPRCLPVILPYSEWKAYAVLDYHGRTPRDDDARRIHDVLRGISAIESVTRHKDSRLVLWSCFFFFFLTGTVAYTGTPADLIVLDPHLHSPHSFIIYRPSLHPHVNL